MRPAHEVPSLRSKLSRTFSFVLFLALSALSGSSASAQSSAATPSPIGLLGWLGCLIGPSVVWATFYWGLYPFLLPRLGPRHAEQVFWPLTIIWLIASIHLSFLYVFSGQWYWIWGGWISATTLSAIAFIWLFFVVIRRST